MSTRPRLAPSADALDLLVEDGVFLGDRIGLIAGVLFVRNVAGPRLPMTDRRLGYSAVDRLSDRWRCSLGIALRDGHGRADQDQEHHRNNCRLHVAPPTSQNCYRPILRLRWVEMHLAAIVQHTIARFRPLFTLALKRILGL